MFEIQKNVPLKDYSTFKIGGKARYFAAVKNVEEITEALAFSFEKEIPFFILGNGSNILFSDEGYKGLIIKIQNPLLTMATPQRVKSKIQNNIIFSEAGVNLNTLVNTAMKNELTGIEWAAGIPGTVGGAIWGNAEALGHSIGEFVKNVFVIEAKNFKCRIKKIKKKDCQFDYRESVFKRKKNLIIIKIEFELRKGNKKKIEEKIKENLTYRKARQPLDMPSAGSVFKNLQLTTYNLQLVKKFPELEKFNKKGNIPVGYLIEKCGLKGKKIEEAKISEKHANFIVNLGETKAKDVKKLIDFAKKKVMEKFGLKLEEEIVIF